MNAKQKLLSRVREQYAVEVKAPPYPDLRLRPDRLHLKSGGAEVSSLQSGKRSKAALW